VPAYRIYVIGLGKDKPASSNKTSKGRADNRRVEVRLMTNGVESEAPASSGNGSAQMSPPK
jgi:hypothetical protein